MTDTLLIALVVSLVVLVVLLAWYLIKTKRANEAVSSPVENKEPTLTGDLPVEEDAEDENKAHLTAWVQGVKPTKTPPIYDQIQREREHQAKLQAEGHGIPIFGAQGLPRDPIDAEVQWRLSVEGDANHAIPVGQISILCDLIDRDLPDIPYEAWGLSEKDGLYYPLRVIATAAREVVVGVSYANRTFLLTQEKASQVRHVIETLASQEYAPLELSVELAHVEKKAKTVQTYVNLFLYEYQVQLVPRQAPVDPAEVPEMVAAANMKPFGDEFGFWTNPYARDPAFRLRANPETPGHWAMVFDAQLTSIRSGDLKRFFEVVNHVASLMGLRCVTPTGRDLTLAEVLQAETQLVEQQERMARLNIPPGSDRAYKLFASGV